ncbi:MAG: Ferredoxin [Bacillus sp. (in: firmicutes)]|nr:Ferredoxin [Bacillus sp. (in: firmicutes)]
MKKLTVGSMKGNTMRDLITFHSLKNKPSIKDMKIKRIMKIEQNQSSYQLEVKKDQTILDAALEQGVPLDYKCQKGTCGRCKVKIVNGSALLQPANHLEKTKLQHLLQQEFRLACQTKAK